MPFDYTIADTYRIDFHMQMKICKYKYCNFKGCSVALLHHIGTTSHPGHSQSLSYHRLLQYQRMPLTNIALVVDCPKSGPGQVQGVFVALALALHVSPEMYWPWPWPSEDRGQRGQSRAGLVQDLAVTIFLIFLCLPMTFHYF